MHHTLVQYSTCVYTPGRQAVCCVVIYRIEDACPDVVASYDCVCELDKMGGCINIIGPNRLVVRTTRCGRVDPGSNPGSDIL